MSYPRLLSAIQRGVWLMEPEAVNSYLPLVAQILSGQPVSFRSQQTNRAEDQEDQQLYFLHQASTTVKPSRYRSFNEAPPGSVAIISLIGPLMKYDDDCGGDPGMATRAKQINEADNHPNIIGTILLADTPGGTFDGTPYLSQTIKATKKPLVTLVDGQLCSAGYFAASGSNEIIASQPTDQIGSIGTMIGFQDIQPALEKQGVVFHFIYADDSSDKNKTFAEAKKGNYKPIKQELLNPVNTEFKKTVSENRGDKLSTTENTLSGKVYLATDALTHGLIDAIGSFDFALQRVYELAEEQKVNPSNTTQPQNSSDMFGKNPLPKTAALANKKAEEITLDEINAVNEEFLTAKITGVTVVNSTIIAEAEKQAGELEAAQSQITKLQGDNASLKAENDQLKAAATEKSNNTPGAAASTPKLSGQEKTDTIASEEDWDAINNLPHNRSIDGHPLFNK